MHHPVSSTGEIVNELANIRCDDAGLRELALFAGAGGGILGGHLLGWRTVCAVEWEPYAACVLAARQNDGILPAFPIWDDVQTFDGKPWAGRVDVVSGGFPCQDISAAGRGAGIEGKRSGMWFHMARIIGEVRPRYVYVENSPMLTSRGLHRVLGDLAEMGFDARWGVISAADVGAPHQRDRIWIVSRYIPPPPPNLANTNSTHEQRNECSERAQQEYADVNSASELGDSNRLRQLQPEGSQQNQRRWSGDSGWWKAEPNVGRVAHGVAARVDRLKAIGNGQVPAVAATAWNLLK